MTKHRHFDGRTRVALAGFGVVGQGVYARLAASPERFEIVGVLCRDPRRHIANGAPPNLLAGRFEQLSPFDLLVEVIGGLAPAEDFVLSALGRGADVVSANKKLLARRYRALQDAAAQSGARLLYSAAVGGGVPMLETVEQYAAKGPIERIDAVVNGTTNFVLERIGAGAELDAALRQAQKAGFAEADPSGDVDGVDAAEKISLLARRAFGVDIDPAAIPTEPLSALSARDIANAEKAGAPYKQIASAWRMPEGVRAEVRLRTVSPEDPLAAPKLEENCLVISLANGARVVLQGKGAGRDPTAESIFSDIEALSRTPAVLRS